MIKQKNILYTAGEIKAMVKTCEKYKQALERARELSKTVTGANYEYIFPELKESEDERIRKALIDYFDDANKSDENPLQSYGIQTDEVIDWLEKQGEQIELKKVEQDNYPRLVMADFNGGDGFYKLNLENLNKEQVDAIEMIITNPKQSLNVYEVIDWLERNSSMFWENPCNPSRIVRLFKEDFLK